jgi:hypothetical protein
VTTEEFFITDAHEDDVFLNEDFFPDIDNLFGDMSLTDDNTNCGSASAPAPTPYVFLIFAFVLQFLGLAIDLDMLDMFGSYRSLVNMVSLISMFLAILCLLFSWIKYHGILLIFPTSDDEGMTNGLSTFAYLAFRPRGDTVEGITKPMKVTAWRGSGT